jgi:hypothetical protein
MSLFSFIKELFTKTEKQFVTPEPSVAPQTVSDMFEPIEFVATPVVEETIEKPKAVKTKPTKKIELTPEQSEKIVKELTNKGVYQEKAPKKKKQK